jgi:hypothetical protein
MTHAIEKALNCTIEHLEGVHEGKVVVDREVFDTLYDYAEQSLSVTDARKQEALDAMPIKSGKHFVTQGDYRYAKFEWAEKYKDVIEAALRADGWQVPDGWQLVPKEPTEEMLDCITSGNNISRTTTMSKWYADMLAAAPQPPKGE